MIQLFNVEYRSLMNRRLQMTIAYRTSFGMNLLSSLISIVVMFYLWNSIYLYRNSISSFTWSDMKSYLFVGFISNTFVSVYSEYRITNRILTGDIILDLLKPLDFQISNLAESLGSLVFEGGVSNCIAVLFAAFVIHISWPSHVISWVLFLCSLVCAFLLRFCFQYLTSLFCFWTQNSHGIIWARTAVIQLFSGALIPISFFPNWLHALCIFLPFQGVVYIPATIFIGRQSVETSLLAVTVQFVWVVVLWWLSRRLFNYSVRKITVHGG